MSDAELASVRGALIASLAREEEARAERDAAVEALRLFVDESVTLEMALKAAQSVLAVLSPQEDERP